MNGFADQGIDEGNFNEPKGISVKAFDAFPKTKTTYLTKTRNGGIWTIVLTSLCAWLTVTEFWRWLGGHTTHTFSVEKGIAHDLQLNLDIVVLMQCDDLHINVQDASGDRVLAGEMLKKDATMWYSWLPGNMVRDPKTGMKLRKDKAVGQEWAKDQALQYRKEEDVHEYLSKAKSRRKWAGTPRLKRGETANACRIYGSVEGNKVQGDFHITARGHGYLEGGRQHLEHNHFNFSHHINELSFGPYFPSISQPLDNTHAATDVNFYKYQYYLSIVPTIYTDAADKLPSSTPPHVTMAQAAELKRRQLKHGSAAGLSQQQHAMAASEPDHASHQYGGGGAYNPFVFSPHTIYTNQYAVTEQSHAVGETAVPGMYFKYDIEPVMLTVAEEWGGLLGLLIRCVNVVAGVMVAGGWLVSLGEWGTEVLAKGRRRRSSAGGLLHGGSEKAGLE